MLRSGYRSAGIRSRCSPAIMRMGKRGEASRRREMVSPTAAGNEGGIYCEWGAAGGFAGGTCEIVTPDSYVQLCER
jgi:hypothetical protein